MQKIRCIFVFFLILVHTSCSLNDDSAFVSIIASEGVIRTGFMVDYLNQEFITKDTPSPCFRMTYPINIFTNTNNKILIENRDGLRQVAQNLSSNFSIIGINLPVTINNNTIDSSSDLKGQLEFCKIKTFEEVLKEKLNSCFNFLYPITVGVNTAPKKEVNNDSELIAFINNIRVGSELSIRYPIMLNSFSGEVEVFNNIGFYKAINACKKQCNNFDIVIDQEQTENQEAIFKINTGNVEDIEKIEWFINGELISDQSTTLYSQNFNEPKKHSICAKVKFKNCLKVKEVCKDILISTSQLPQCNRMTIENSKEGLAKGTYRFQIDENFLRIFTNSQFRWEINNVVIENNLSSVLEYQFNTAGSYEICTTFIDLDCPGKPKRCVVINVLEEEL